MCDTTLAPPASTAGRVMLFGKNSDRQRNEAEVVEFHSAATHAAGAMQKCTYISIPQVARTNAVVLCRPFWMWGAEMGANEHGLVIGNEALHAREPAQQDEALLGDDLVRLALERATTAAEAVDIITTLLERYGQGGNNGHLTPSYFNNGFMIADAREGYVLETVGRDWLLERVDGVRAMSNRYSIGAKVLRTSDGLSKVLERFGSPGVPANYADALANPNREHIGFASARRACTTSLLRARDGRLTAIDMMRILRDHGAGDAPHPHWADDAYVRRSVCMHAGGIDSTGQTTGTMVSEIRPMASVHWVTATSSPCTSIFKPVFLDAFPIRRDLTPTDRFDPATLWWRHETIHRAAIAGHFARFLEDVTGERDALEERFHTRVAAVLDGGTAQDRAASVAQCWAEADSLENAWSGQVSRWISSAPTPQREGWMKMNEVAGLPMNA